MNMFIKTKIILKIYPRYIRTKMHQWDMIWVLVYVNETVLIVASLIMCGIKTNCTYLYSSTTKENIYIIITDRLE